MDDLRGRRRKGDGDSLMSPLNPIPSRLRRLLWPVPIDKEVDDELGAHIELQIKRFMERGMTAVEIKASSAPKMSKGFQIARDDINPQRSFVVHTGDDRFTLGAGVEAIGLRGLMAELAEG